MTEPEAPPCVNGCTRKDETGELVPLRAFAGAFCGRCYRRAEAALDLVAPMVEHLLSLVPLGSAAPLEPTGIHGSKAEAPIPGRWEALSDANLIYLGVARWAQRWAYELGMSPIRFDGEAWLDAWTRVVGLHTSNPVDGRRAAARVAGFLILNLDVIFDDTAVDVRRQRLMSKFISHLQLIDQARYRWPTEDRPMKDAKTVCPGCLRAGGIVVYPPDYKGQDARVVCALCGHRLDTTPIAGPLRFGQTHMPNEYELARLDQAKAHRKQRTADERKRARSKRDGDSMAGVLVDRYREQLTAERNAK